MQLLPKRHWLVDCQKDFHPGGSLAIPTANDDVQRIVQFIQDHATKIDRIVATLDTHLKLHIANPSFWYKGGEDAAELEHPEPFTIISADDLKKGLWKPRTDLILPCDTLDEILDPQIFRGRAALMTSSSTAANDGDANTTTTNHHLDLEKYCIEYATRLEQGNQFKICIWPEHCLLGSEGHALVPEIQQALHAWSETTGRSVEFVCKGQHILTEMYSVFQAEVPVTKETALNQPLLDSLLHHHTKKRGRFLLSHSEEDHQHQRILVCGQAMSHCVNYTVRDLVGQWEKHAKEDSKQQGVAAVPVDDRPTQIAVLTDCSSVVPGFEEAGQTFLKDMQAKGVHLIESTEVFGTALSS